MKEAILAAKEYAPFVRKIEVETENLDMVREAVEAGADIIMLDNMTTEQMAEAIRIIDGRARVFWKYYQRKYRSHYRFGCGLCLQRSIDPFSSDFRFEPETFTSTGIRKELMRW